MCRSGFSCCDQLFFVSRYGFSNMRYIASLISGVGIFMMGAGLSWYHGIMGLLHPEPIESLLWVSDFCLAHNVHKEYQRSNMSRFLCCRLTVFWRALWCLKEVGDENETVAFWWHSWQNVFFFKWNIFLFSFLSNVTSSRQWDKEERPPERSFFLWIRCVQLKSYDISASYINCEMKRCHSHKLV